MKRLLLTAFAATVTASGALAADVMPIVVPPPPPIVVPVPEPSNLYVSAFGGIVLVRNAVWYQPDPEATLHLRGFRLGGAIGMNIGGGPLAVEADVTWARASLTAVCAPPPDGDQCREPDDEEAVATLLTVMGNLRFGPTDGFFRPYAAVGGGMARLSLVSDMGADGVGPGGGDNTDWTWGFQAIVGVDLAITDNLLVGARYRYQRIGPTSFIDLGDDPFDVGPLNVHSIEGGITIRFGG
ncbi:MAG: porin family protein [Bauldia sp.]|nr:porin family protein [Bauldia sp.]MCW5718192.1 porin family protein [Bauldia sp.]